MHYSQNEYDADQKLDGVERWGGDVCGFCRALARIKELETKLHEKELDYNKANYSLNSAESKLQEIGIELQNRERWLGSMKQHYFNVEEKWKHEYGILQKKLQNNEFEIRELQRTELARLHRDEQLMDGTAKDDLRNALQIKVQGISRPFFRKINWRESTRVTPNLNEILPGLLDLRWAKAPWPLIRDSPDFSTTSLVDALLFTAMTTRFFKNPFFGAEGEPALKGVLDRFYFHGQQMGLYSTEPWRKATVELIKESSSVNYPASSGAGNDEPYPQQQIKKISHEVSTLLLNFLNLHDAIDPSKSSVLEDKVYELVDASAKLAEDWHSREFRFVVTDLDWIEANNIDWNSEGVDRYITPKNRTLEENVKYTILAVISPGFVRYEQGEKPGTETEIVWEKASVLLGEVEDSGGEGGEGANLHGHYQAGANESFL
ncbi:hypothetical protein TWF481_009091 [Arthrobotrys musiformis]|uniref:Uncharacterized protein n=1 Tax=Arthrobotrys musiformis TaxID=47236 RepID=A0AAV9W4Q8_9PEZI